MLNTAVVWLVRLVETIRVKEHEAKRSTPNSTADLFIYSARVRTYFTARIMEGGKNQESRVKYNRVLVDTEESAPKLMFIEIHFCFTFSVDV